MPLRPPRLVHLSAPLAKLCPLPGSWSSTARYYKRNPMAEAGLAELPEVETMRRDLEREVVGRRVERAHVAQTRMLGGQDPDDLSRRLEGRTVTGVSRRGKYLFLHLDSDEALLIHRGMTGNLFLKQ